MTSQTFTFKIQNLYGAYSPSAGVCCYGDCWEEAVNELTDKLRAIRETPAQGVGGKGDRDAVL